MEKKCNVIMLTTEKEGVLCIRHDKPHVLKERKNVISPVILTTHNHYHLYITSDDKIKEGDWAVNQGDYDKDIVFRTDEGFFQSGISGKKIIATTDSSLYQYAMHSEGKVKVDLPQIPESFIQAYVKAGGIDEILVKYDLKCTLCNEPYLINEGEVCNDALCVGTTVTKLKLRDDNTIIIEGVEPKMYSEEEVKAEIKRAYIHGQGNAEMMEAGLERNELEDYVSWRMLQLSKE